MNGLSDWDPDWWKKEKAKSLARKQVKATSSKNGVRPGDAFLVVTEGTVTEPVYFELLKSELGLSNVFVQVIPGDGSDPISVINTALNTAKEQLRKAKKSKLSINEPRKFDHVWAVIDTDVAMREGIWNDAVQLAQAHKVKLAHSTPCIEYWLLLHLVDKPTTRGDLEDGEAAKSAVKNQLGKDYSTNEETAREVLPIFIQDWPRAVKLSELVRQYHLDAGTTQPANPSTEVDLLVRALNNSAQSHLQRL